MHNIFTNKITKIMLFSHTLPPHSTDSAETMHKWKLHLGGSTKWEGSISFLLPFLIPWNSQSKSATNIASHNESTPGFIFNFK